MEDRVHTGGEGLITIHLLASPVRMFLWKAVDFSLAFLSSSISTYRISPSRPPCRVCQTRVAEEAERNQRMRGVRPA